MKYLADILMEHNMGESTAIYLSYCLLAFAIVFVCVLSHIITKYIIFRILSRIINRNKSLWDDVLLERKVFHRLAHMIPALIVYLSAPLFINTYVQEGIKRFATSYILIMVAMMISAILDSINDIYRTYPISRVRPIKGLLQVIKIAVVIISGIILIANLMNKDPLILLSGIGALAAVFSFVFKDSILGFITGIQLTSNDMLRIGDWIEMPKYGADGDVIDITLNTVKVQNWDKTIVTIPAYALVSDSFKNWRGMTEFGGRRIKRAIYIDVNSISFCTEEMLDRFKRIEYLKEYIINKENEIEQYNREHSVDTELQVNGRHMTNIGTFRIYIKEYLRNHPGLHKGMEPMVRQLQPGEHGLPLEIYTFTDGTAWAEYEVIQADIFDHIFAVAKDFGLRIFQNPTGHDLRSAKQEYKA